MYRGVADGLVRNDPGYERFNALEGAELAQANARPKPVQPAKMLGELLRMSVAALPLLDKLMGETTYEANLGVAHALSNRCGRPGCL